MIITILTLFPQVFTPLIQTSIIGRAQQKKLLSVNLTNIRDYAFDKHGSVDDRPFGGGPGMLMRVDVLDRAISAVKKKGVKEKIVLLDPKGTTFSQAKAKTYSGLDHLILVCGHYEGFDARIYRFTDEIISIGNYILTGGEIPAMVIADCVARLIPGVLTKSDAVKNESFTVKNILESPQYTRPAIYKGARVPRVLLSGNHLQIALWRKKHQKTKRNLI